MKPFLESWDQRVLGPFAGLGSAQPCLLPPVVAGIGCRAACPPEALVSAVRAAEALSGRAATVLAAPVSRASVAREAALALGLPLSLVPPAALAAAQPRCVTLSARALSETGVASVAEGAALAAAGPRAVLLLARTGRGWATCALAG